MSDAAASPKKATKAKKPKTAPTHPKVSDMVNGAISTLKERGGSSLVAIKKYISATYKVDADKLSPFIKKYLKNAVASGGLVQTKGKGASGSFRIGGAAAPKKEKKKPAAKPKKAAAAKPKVAKPKAAKTSPKKAAKPKKAASPKKPKAAKLKKASPKKAAKPKKAASPKKPKAAKPKKPKASPKKAASKRGKK